MVCRVQLVDLGLYVYCFAPVFGDLEIDSEASNGRLKRMSI